jgi:hypothetical protein
MGRWAAMVLAAVTVLAGCTGSDDAATDAGTPTVVASGECPNESAVVQDARRTSRRSADVDGDGARDTISLVEEATAEPSCRIFVVVDTGGVTYSAPASVLGYPEITGETVFRMVQLGGSDGAEIVFTAYGTGIGALTVYRVFTFAGGRLRPVAGSYDEVVDDPSRRPVGVGCVDGGVVISEASARDPDLPRTVDRRFFALSGDDLKPRGESTRQIPPGEPLPAALPEFTRPLFGGC